MSWLAKSIANSLKLDDDDDELAAANQNPTSLSSSDPHGGLKGDLSELSQTLSRQFWGVASFLAPPPPQPSDPEASDDDVIAGIRSNFAEIGGRFKSGISKFSSNINVSEFTKIASNLLQFGSEEEAEAAGLALGVTPEVLAFVRNVAVHPETWLDFPLSDDHDHDSDNGFELSDVQQEHALAVERLAPAFSALRMELCPEHMSESHFWMIYFVLVYPKLTERYMELLSTPKIVEVRAMLSHELKKGNIMKSESDAAPSGTGFSQGVTDSPEELQISVPQTDSVQPQTSTVTSVSVPAAVEIETEKHTVQSSEIQIVDKPVIEEKTVKEAKYPMPASTSSSKAVDDQDEDDADDWLKEESEMDGGVGVGGTSIPIENDEDVSFSDLEDDDADIPSGHKKSASSSDSSGKEKDWVQLGRSAGPQASSRNPETKESNDWLDIDDTDAI